MAGRLVFMGLGPLGIKAVQYAHERGLSIVGAVDLSPALQGKTLAQVCALPGLDVPICASLADAVGVGADTLILTTVSKIARVSSQIEQAVTEGLDVVSTCEELVYPWGVSDWEARKIDELAQRFGVSVLATGVNPGFLMDYLPSVLVGLCQRVDRVRVERFQDASTRRLPFQRKIGAGLSLSEFEQKVAEGTLRHVGLRESLAMIAAALGWTLDRMEEEIAPVQAVRDLPSGDTTLAVQAGQVLGVQQIGRGWCQGEERITLHFRATLGEERSYDRILIEGLPGIDSTMAGGINGDVATCAVLLNAAERIARLRPGLRTMLDLPVLGCGHRALSGA